MVRVAFEISLLSCTQNGMYVFIYTSDEWPPHLVYNFSTSECIHTSPTVLLGSKNVGVAVEIVFQSCIRDLQSQTHVFPVSNRHFDFRLTSLEFVVVRGRHQQQ